MKATKSAKAYLEKGLLSEADLTAIFRGPSRDMISRWSDPAVGVSVVVAKAITNSERMLRNARAKIWKPGSATAGRLDQPAPPGGSS